MSYGAYFATQPSTRTYIDTSQPLNGFGAAEGGSDLLAIYDGVAGLGAAPAGCGCAGTRGRLSGFGDEVLPDGTSTGTLVPSAFATNLKTGLVALIAVSSVAVMAYFFLGGSKMRANKRRRRGAKMRRNGKAIPAGGERSIRALKRRITEEVATLGYGEAKALRRAYQQAVLDESYRTGHALSTVKKRSIALDFANEVARTYGVTPKDRKVFLEAFMHGLRMPKKPHRSMRPNGAPAYLLQKKGKTTKRQAKAAGHYLAETRWHGGPKRTARWSGKHLAHKRFNTNGMRPRIMSGYGFVLDEMRAPSAWRTAPSDDWEIRMVRRPSRPAKVLGQRNIDGSLVNVFQISTGKIIAQQTQYGYGRHTGGLPAR